MSTSISFNKIGNVGAIPAFPALVTSDSFSQVTSAGWADSNMGINALSPTDFPSILYDYSPPANYGTLAQFSVSIVNGVTTLIPIVSSSAYTPTNPALPKIVMSDSVTYPVDGLLTSADNAGSQKPATGNDNTIINSMSSISSSPTTPLKTGIDFGSNLLTSGTAYGGESLISALSPTGTSLFGDYSLLTLTGTSGGNNQLAGDYAVLSVSGFDIAASDDISAHRADFGISGETPTGVMGNSAVYSAYNESTVNVGAWLRTSGDANYFVNFAHVGASSAFISPASGSTASGTLQNLKLNYNGVDYYILAASTAY